MPSNNYTSLPRNGTTADESPSSDIHLQPAGLVESADEDSGIYEGVASNEPTDLPPAYEPSHLQEFDIEEPLEDGDTHHSTNLRRKAGLFAQSFNRRIVQPINNALDPVYQLYCYSNARFEYFISKLGNPLIVKRVLYIFFVATILYCASLSGLNSDGVVGSHSDFMNPQKLLEFIELSVDPKRLEENLEYLSSMPHLSGTTGDLALARYFEQLIIQSRLSMNPDILFETYTNYPLDPKVELLDKNNNVVLSLDLKENLDDHIENDFYKLAFNPGSRDMTSKGKLIYANYGELKDYRLLEKNSIDVRNSILLIKYGGIYPAYKKIQYAQERGAVGVLFISDPVMDKYYNLDSLQREPVSFTNKSPGNIIGPGNLAGTLIDHNGDLEEKIKQSGIMPSIPSLPIKWKDFITIMDKLSNKGSRVEDWDVTIHDNHIPIWTGDNSDSDAADGELFEVLLQNSLTQRPYKESWNIAGKLEGSEQDNFAIIVGASRDSSCYGAMENSGSAILLELINIFNAMSSSLLWRPLRTVYFVSYTGSKYNLAGSTHFSTRNSEFFRRDVYAFIDLDDIIQGNELEIEADPLFQLTIKNAINTLMSSNLTESEINYDSLNEIQNYLDPSSSGYQLTEFHNIGTISVKLKNKNLNIGHNPSYPKNSCLDTFANFRDSQLDPDMSKHSFMTKLVASIIAKLSDTPIIPYDVRSFFDNINKNLDALKAYSIKRKKNLNFKQVDEFIRKVTIISEQNEAFITTWNDICDNGYGSEPNLLSVNRWDWNSKLLLLTKVMIDMDGTFNNPYNHNVFYGVESDPELRYDIGGELENKVVVPKHGFPGVWDAIDQNDWQNAQLQLNHVADMLDRCLNLFQY